MLHYLKKRNYIWSNLVLGIDVLQIGDDVIPEKLSQCFILAF